MPMEFCIKRIYDEPGREDGCRVLVDRLWPRGVAKADAMIDFWSKDFAPSTELRKWFHQDSSQFDEFSARYSRELEEKQGEIKETFEALEQSTITLLTAVTNVDRSHAAVFKRFLEKLTV